MPKQYLKKKGKSNKFSMKSPFSLINIKLGGGTKIKNIDRSRTKDKDVGGTGDAYMATKD